jgi:hypothetical protein
MIDASYAEVGKSLELPTHCYLGASDSKLVDAQAGLESGISALLGALAGINMISGAGMLDFLACQSAEKLVVDAEAVGMVKRLLAGLESARECLLQRSLKASTSRATSSNRRQPVRCSRRNSIAVRRINRDSVRVGSMPGASTLFSGEAADAGPAHPL